MNALARIHRTINADIDIPTVMDLGGFDLDRVLEQRPDFLQKEYPFEWAGAWHLPAGAVELCYGEGPDASIGAMLIPLSSDTDADLDKAISIAELAFDREGKRATSGAK